jgi:DNA adenine methylase
MTYRTPLRYPGGKAKLSPFVRKLFELNNLCDAAYLETYAGGAGVAMDLLLSEYARTIHLNDISYGVYCFWHSVIHSTEYICRRVRDVKVSPTTWKRQRNILNDTNNRSLEEVGFAFLFLNRTNRSGILSGGMIGGREQTGPWLIDARFYRTALIERILTIAEYGHRISIYCMDAEIFIGNIANRIKGKCCVYYDPPYYIAGQRLYVNNYQPTDHARIARTIQVQTPHPWFLTYDAHEDIRQLYQFRRQRLFDLRYTAAQSHQGTEVMVFSDSLRIPTRII